MTFIQSLLQLPRPLLIGASLLEFNALLLLTWWLVFPEDVSSNGAQVFFIMLWFSAAWGLILGEGWIRIGIACLIVAFVWGIVNQPSIDEALAKLNFAEVLSKLVALVAVLLLYLPTSHRWFKSRAAIELE